MNICWYEIYEEKKINCHKKIRYIVLWDSLGLGQIPMKIEFTVLQINRQLDQLLLINMFYHKVPVRLV